MNSRFRALISSFLLLMLSACGGGGSVEREGAATGTGTTGGNTPPAPEVSINMSVANEAGEATNELSVSTPLIVSASVTDAEGNPMADTLVTFSFNVQQLASFNNDAGTGLTNSDGVATIGLEVGSDKGDGLVMGIVEHEGSSFSGQVGFRSAGLEQTPVSPASVEFFASSVQLASSGSDQIELIAVVKNEQNVLLEGVEVSFAANNGAELQITQGSTAADGTARAIMTSSTNPENRTITATASAGSLSQTLDIDVVGTEVNITGQSSVIINDPVQLTIVLVNSDGEGIPNQPVSLSVQNGSLSNENPVTSANGQVQVAYTASSSGQDLITASALNAQGSLNLLVQQDQFEFTTLPSGDVALGNNGLVTVTWEREGQPFAGGNVVFTASRGTVSNQNVVTNDAGQASVSISSNNAGVSSITAQGSDDEGNLVSTSAQVEFIATEAHTVRVDATPDSIGPDGQTSTITAVVRDPSGNLVKGESVNFRVEDVSGGTVFPNFATTDSSGIASTVYTSNSVSSQDAVVLIAEIADNTAIMDSTVLTVGDRAFDITLGTGREIQAPDAASYLKEFAVFVSDADSNPVTNATLTVAATPVKFSQGGTYRKGRWVYDSDAEIWRPEVTVTCANEDINGNGLLDAGEDTNGDGFLTPGNVVVASNQIVTDANGQGTVEIRYPKQYGPWTDIELRVSGQSAGSEAVQSQDFTLTVAASDIQDEASPPPENPFGSGTSCTNTL